MGKHRRAKNRQRFGYSVDRRKLSVRMRNKIQPRVADDIVRAAWHRRRHITANMRNMGLAYKVNKCIPLCQSAEAAAVSSTAESVAEAAPEVGLTESEREDSDGGSEGRGFIHHQQQKQQQQGRTKKAVSVADRLQAHADSLARRQSVCAVRLPRAIVQFVETMMARHGGDYVAMARDSANHNQLTPCQLRQLVRRFWSIPEHYTSYMKRHGLLEKPTQLDADVQLD